jgi:hypothetical protein
LLILAGKCAVIQDQVDVARRDSGFSMSRLLRPPDQVVRLLTAADTHTAESEIVQCFLPEPGLSGASVVSTRSSLPLQDLFHALFFGKARRRPRDAMRTCRFKIAPDRSAAKPP